MLRLKHSCSTTMFGRLIITLTTLQKTHNYICLRHRFSTSSSKLSDTDLYNTNKKISEFTRSGRINEARQLFEQMSRRNIVSWNSIMGGYVKRRETTKARKLFDEMPQRDVVSWNLMISGYVSCGFLEEGRWFFDEMPERDCVSWNSMISGYAKCGRMDEALRLFEKMPVKNAVSWNAMVSGFLQNGNVVRAVDFFRRMPERDGGSLNALVSGLVDNEELDEAASVLKEFVNKADEKEGLVSAFNTLIAGYAQRGKVDEARKLFDQIPYDKSNRKQGRKGMFERNLVSWNTMIMCYVKAGNIESARGLFDKMKEKDTFSWNTMLSGYVHIGDMNEASSIFRLMPDPDILTWNTMISGSAQKGKFDLAKDLFDVMPEKNLVSWNSIIAGYMKNEDYKGAIKLFIRMQVEGEKPDRHTLSSVLSASTGFVDLHLGMQIHQMVSKTVIPDVPINNALITMYSKCGAIKEARIIFDGFKMIKEVISWNAMIGGYASHGYASEALKCFELMKKCRVQPSYITFISVLHACALAGLIDEGRAAFKSMVDEFGIEPRVEHYSSMVHILGRHGQLEEAQALIKNMPLVPDNTVWGALLSASRVHNNVEVARVAAEALMKLEPESSTPYVLLHNIYADVGQWDNAREVRNLMESNKIKKAVGYSWVNSSG